MAAIVATLLYWPAAIGAALLLRLSGVRLHAVATFGGLFATSYAGMAAWWVVFYVAALVYAAFAIRGQEG